MTTPPPRRRAHPYYMYECVRDQPEAIRQVLKSQGGRARELGRRISDARNVHIVGVGTSWHAALVGEYLMRLVGGRDDARAWNSFEFHSYPPHLIADDVVIVMSHRGTKRYSLWSLEQAKKAGAQTALVTGQDSRGRLELADVVLETSYQDRSAAFTISHTSAMTALAMAALQTKSAEAMIGPADLAALPDGLTVALGLEPEVRSLARALSGASRWVFAGWGFNVPTAMEVALKINEAAYVATNAYQLEYFLHGPFVATSQGCVVCFMAPPGAGYARAVQFAEGVKETGAIVVALVQEGDREMKAVADHVLELPVTPEPLSPIVYLMPLQLLTYWLALELGHNPDTFRLDEPRHKAAMKSIEL